MSGSATTTTRGALRTLFALATAPARVVGLWHANLRATIAADAATFASPPAAVFFALLTGAAVAYPIAASIVHAVGSAAPRAETLKLALLPFFDIVYSESLPFMIAAVAIGTFSPALGVLFMSIFIPADLVAAGTSTTELQPRHQFGQFPAPYLARMISYGLLWILTVEIPLRARIWADAWAGIRGQRSAIIGIAVRLCATAVLVFFWSRALPWLIQPVFAWTPLQLTPEASSATWVHWPILVLTATLIAGVASIWPKPAQPSPASTEAATPPASTRSMGRVLVRQTIAVVVVAVLFAGLMTTIWEAVVLVLGLILTGPVLTVLLRVVRVPRSLGVIPMPHRIVAATAIAFAAIWVILSLAGDALFEGYLVMVITLAVVAPLFRFLLEAGAGRQGDEPASSVSGPSKSAVISTILLLTFLAVLVFPSVAWADNCPTASELRDCLRRSLWAAGAMLGAATMAIVGAMSGPDVAAGMARWFNRTPTPPRTGPPPSSRRYGFRRK